MRPTDRAVVSLRLVVNPELPGFPDFRGPMDPIGVPKSDFAALRMTALLFADS
jgi:hypothetical protein